MKNYEICPSCEGTGKIEKVSKVTEKEKFNFSMIEKMHGINWAVNSAFDSEGYFLCGPSGEDAYGYLSR